MEIRIPLFARANTLLDANRLSGRSAPLASTAASDATDPALQIDLLGTLLSNLEGMIYRCRADEHWAMEFVSQGCLDLTGYRPQDLIFNSRISYEELTHPDDRLRVRKVIYHALACRKRFDLEYRIVRIDGEVRWVSERGTAIAHPNNELIALEGFIQDITERKQTDEALREAERRYRSIFENTVEGIFQSTPNKGYLAVNPALARIYGYDSPEQLTANLRDIEISGLCGSAATRGIHAPDGERRHRGQFRIARLSAKRRDHLDSGECPCRARQRGRDTFF